MIPLVVGRGMTPADLVAVAREEGSDGQPAGEPQEWLDSDLAWSLLGPPGMGRPAAD